MAEGNSRLFPFNREFFAIMPEKHRLGAESSAEINASQTNSRFRRNGNFVTPNRELDPPNR
jgi:hypothetical protein